MNSEPLLGWMAHVGGGSWTAFRRAVAYFAEADTSGDGTADADVRRARTVLSDLGYACFFIDGGSSWKAFAPTIGVVYEGEAIVCGVRNGRLVESITQASQRAGCEITVEELHDAPPRIALRGDEAALSAVADAEGLGFVADLPRRLAAALVPIPSMIEAGETSDPPINWSHSAFDLHRLSWSEVAATPTAHAYHSRYGAVQHFVDVPGRGLVALDRRSAVYTAAYVNGVDLVEYDNSTASLSTALEAPLPSAYARAATLCSGQPSTVVDGRIIYSTVPPGIGAVLTVGLGGTYPGSPKWSRRRRSPSR